MALICAWTQAHLPLWRLRGAFFGNGRGEGDCGRDTRACGTGSTSFEFRQESASCRSEAPARDELVLATVESSEAAPTPKLRVGRAERECYISGGR